MKKILVVDDEPGWLKLTRERLAHLGHEVLLAGGFVEALEILSATALDLVVLDVQMPVDGRVLFRIIRMQWPKLPVFIHTVYEKQLRYPGVNLASEGILKTADCRDLVDAVNRCLGRLESAASARGSGREDRETRRPRVGRQDIVSRVRRGSMAKDIGECAGKVWQALQKTGKAPLNALMKETGLTTPDIHRAVGWLARENKITIIENGKYDLVQLNGAEHH